MIASVAIVMAVFPALFAIVLAMGSTVPRDLKVPGRELEGIYFAMDFLPQQNRVVAGLGAVRTRRRVLAWGRWADAGDATAGDDDGLGKLSETQMTRPEQSQYTGAHRRGGSPP